MKNVEKKFTRFIELNLVFCLFVIVFGALVRASHSGAGCGSHWPLCQGGFVPKTLEIKTLIEYTHRATSGLILLGSILIFFFARKLSEENSSLRKASFLYLFFMITEALLGASLVLLELVEKNSSILRVLVIGTHLVNTYFLLASITACLYYAKNKDISFVKLKNINKTYLLLGLSLLITGASGAVAALSDTLFPANELKTAILEDFTSNNLLIRLRIIHPIIASLTAIFSCYFSINMTQGKTLNKIFLGLVILQVALGLLNIYFLTPINLQLIHLLFADLIWLSFIWLLLEDKKL